MQKKSIIEISKNNINQIAGGHESFCEYTLNFIFTTLVADLVYAVFHSSIKEPAQAQQHKKNNDKQEL